MEWDDCVLDYAARIRKKKTAINTPSYSQITEKIYTRATNRWLRYRNHMEPVLDILAPYAEYFNYSMEAAPEPTKTN